MNSKNIKVCDFIEKNKQLLSKVKPCFIVKHEDMTKFFNKNAACLMSVVDSKYIKDIATPEERQTGLNNMIRLALDSSLKI